MSYGLITADGRLALLPNTMTREQMGERLGGALSNLYSDDPVESDDYLRGYCDDVFASYDVLPPVNQSASALFDEEIRGEVIPVGDFADEPNRDARLSDEQWARIAAFYANR